MRKVICFAILAVLSLQLALAISTDMKDSYLPGETAIFGVYGNILEPITKTNVEFVRAGHVIVPLDYDTAKAGDNYYIWAIMPQAENNYTLRIKDITTTVAGIVQKLDYEKNFSVAGNLTDYSVKPGVVSTEKDFEIEAQLNEDFNKMIQIIFITEESFTLKPGANVIKFSVSGINETQFLNVTIGKYILPVYIRVNKTAERAEGINVTNVSEEEIIPLNTTQKWAENISGEEAIAKERKKYYCYEFPGVKCNASQTCTGMDITSADGLCCVNGACAVKKEEAASSYAWVGYLIAAIVVIGAIFLWYKYKKVKPEEKPIQKKVAEIEGKALESLH